VSDQIRASDWCAAHREWSPCPDCETDATIARLTRERDDARAALAAGQRELHRLAHGHGIEGDGVCMHELVAHDALREIDRLRGVVHTYMTSHDEQIAQERLALIGQAVRERDAARAEAEEAAAAYNAARRDLATETATRAALRTQESRIMGILADAGVPVGDVVRGVEALARRHDALNAEVNALHQELADMDPNATANAHRWSRLWHAEARRLWQETQVLAAKAREPACCSVCGLPVHPEHDACRLSREGAR